MVPEQLEEPRVAVAPEVAARIVARSAAGKSAVAIGGELHMTLFEVRDVLRAADHDTAGHAARAGAPGCAARPAPGGAGGSR